MAGSPVMGWCLLVGIWRVWRELGFDNLVPDLLAAQKFKVIFMPGTTAGFRCCKTSFLAGSIPRVVAGGGGQLRAHQLLGISFSEAAMLAPSSLPKSPSCSPLQGFAK